MTILTSSINVGGTISSTGGTATGLLYKNSSGNDLTAILDDSSEYVDQTVIGFHARDPKIREDAPNGYTQARSGFKILRPLLLDNASYTKNSAKFDLSVDHETTAAEVLALRVLSAHLIYLSAMDGFYNSQLLDN